uniref:Uncharacterized protein n=1 Tax=Oryza punctata TaxID=4537 RepID=A0A0E0KLS3_ORYPU
MQLKPSIIALLADIIAALQSRHRHSIAVPCWWSSVEMGGLSWICALGHRPPLDQPPVPPSSVAHARSHLVHP